jgi:predicted aspartyl protease
MPTKLKRKVITKKEVKLEIVELQTDSYHVFLHVLVNNKKLRMLLDTGASKTVLDKAFVDTKLKSIKLESSNNPTSSLHATVQTSDVMTAKSITIGPSKLQNYMITVLDLAHVNKTYKMVKCKPIQGILGSDILVEKQAVIDYGKKQLKLKK